MTKGQFIVQRHGSGEDQAVPVEFLFSNQYAIGFYLRIHFPHPSVVEFRAMKDFKISATHIWQVDVTTKKGSKKIEPDIELGMLGVAENYQVPKPDYLAKEMKHFSHYGDSGLAPAFLMHLGILKEEPQYPDCTCAVSPDGRHILFSAKKGPLAEYVIYGDLVTKQTVRWKVPKEITPRHFQDFFWVVTP